MKLKVGVIGMGTMGEIHLRNLLEMGSDVQVVGFFEPNLERSSYISQSYGIASYEDAVKLVRDENINAIVIASPANQHFSSVSEAIKQGKYVFCEKPLVTSLQDSLDLVELEQAQGQHLIWVNFMRRFDNSFLNLKSTFDGGSFGTLNYSRMSHRNPGVPSSFTNTDYMLETFIHEFDVINWLLGGKVEKVSTASLALEKPTPNSFTDPLFIHLSTSQGFQITLDGHINNGYGYQILCELVCSKGAIDLDVSGPKIGAGNRVFRNWSERFQQAYQSSLLSWFNDIQNGTHTGATSSDAESALRVAMAAIASLSRSEPVDVS